MAALFGGGTPLSSHSSPFLVFSSLVLFSLLARAAETPRFRLFLQSAAESEDA
jgi:hypothetical protein